jgi:hypothetical protein
MVLRRMFERDNRTLKKTKLDIKSPLIKRIIKEVVKEEKAAMESEKASVEWPNENLFRYVSFFLFLFWLIFNVMLDETDYAI